MTKIRLLEKSEIGKLKNADLSREISEGLKISRKVDALRELKASEEASLEKFRSATLEEIGKETATLNSQKEELLEKINVLEKKLAEMLPELGTTRKELDSLKKKLEKWQKELEVKDKAINLKEIDIALALKEATQSLSRQGEHEIGAQLFHEKIMQEELEASETLTRARKIEATTLHEKEAIEQILSQREGVISRREDKCRAKEEENLIREGELRQKEIQLVDREATLERSLERIRQNRLA